jgi:predicted RNA-binding protein with PIN domain
VGTLVVDGNNVVGAVPDGWWRDRPAAVRRLVGRLRCHAEATGDRVVLALDVAQPDLPAGDNHRIEVVYPARRGRDAADHRIVELLDELGAAAGDVEVVTSDRALAAGAAERGARVTGARSFLSRLEARGC